MICRGKVYMFVVEFSNVISQLDIQDVYLLNQWFVVLILNLKLILDMI